MIDISTSIDSLSPDSPILPVMLSTPTPPWVKYHNVVGVTEEDTWKNRIAGHIAGRGDGVVAYDSAHLDNVASEIVVPADHLSVHSHPRSVLEVRRILLEHLRDVDAGRQFDPNRQVQLAKNNDGRRFRDDSRGNTRPSEQSFQKPINSVPPQVKLPDSLPPANHRPKRELRTTPANMNSWLPPPSGWTPHE